MFDQSKSHYFHKLSFANLILGIIFFIIILRLGYLQIIKGEQFYNQSQTNQLRVVKIIPPRGRIYDRNGNILATNVPSFNLELIPEATNNPDEIIKKIAQLINLDENLLFENYNKLKTKRFKYEAKLLFKNLDRDRVAVVEANRYQLPGVNINPVPARFYPNNQMAAHLLGYTREINLEQLNSEQFVGYSSGDIVGQKGIEKTFENILQGQKGKQTLIVNAFGQKIKEAYFQPPISGQDVVLSIDLNIQRASEDALANNSGVIVAINPNNGEVLSLVSKPSYDPNIFSGEITKDIWQDLFLGDNKKLTNKAVSGTYPPGSIHKIFMASSGLTEGVVSTKDKIFCPGHYRVGNSRPFKCHKESGHGAVDLIDALKMSCNVYFYTLGERLGIDRIFKDITAFGFNEATNIELDSEKTGLIPSSEWKKKYFKKPEDQKWYAGETPSVSIGQGANIVTPIQIARALAGLVNGGKIFDLTLIKDKIPKVSRNLRLE